MDSEAGTWLGLATVIIATLLGYASSMVQESRRRRYEEEVAVRDRERTHRRYLQDLRFQTYVAMITAANHVYAAVGGTPDRRRARRGCRARPLRVVHGLAEPGVHGGRRQGVT